MSRKLKREDNTRLIDSLSDRSHQLQRKARIYVARHSRGEHPLDQGKSIIHQLSGRLAVAEFCLKEKRTYSQYTSLIRKTGIGKLSLK